MISIVVIVFSVFKSIILAKVKPPQNTPISKAYKQIWNTVFVITWYFFIFLLKSFTSERIRSFHLKTQQPVPIVFILLLAGFDFSGKPGSQVIAKGIEAVKDGNDTSLLLNGWNWEHNLR